MKIKSSLINLLYPKDIKCVVCGKELSQNTHYAICSKCDKSVARSVDRCCIKCGEPIKHDGKRCKRCVIDMPSFTRSFSPLLYEGAVQKMIKEFKYNNKRYLSRTLGNFLVESYVLNNLNCDIVVPVPLHQDRQRSRGFNQAELLSNQLNINLGLTVSIDNLIRVKNTKSQTNLSKKQREENVSKAFVVQDKSLFKDKVVLLVDDVFTTGSTLNECADKILSSGASKVYCLTLAHTMGKPTD